MRSTGAGDGGDRRVKVGGGFKVNKGPGLAPLQMQVNLRASLGVLVGRFLWKAPKDYRLNVAEISTPPAADLHTAMYVSRTAMALIIPPDSQEPLHPCIFDPLNASSFPIPMSSQSSQSLNEYWLFGYGFVPKTGPPQPCFWLWCEVRLTFAFILRYVYLGVSSGNLRHIMVNMIRIVVHIRALS